MNTQTTSTPDSPIHRALECLEILVQRPAPRCRDCADSRVMGVCDNGGLNCDMVGLIKEAKASLAALAASSPVVPQDVVAEPRGIIELAESSGGRMPSMSGFPAGALWFEPEGLLLFAARLQSQAIAPFLDAAPITSAPVLPIQGYIDPLSGYLGTVAATPRYEPLCKVSDALAAIAASSPAAPAQPVANAENAIWLIYFDDAEKPPQIIQGERGARHRFGEISGNWNAHLFVKMESNCHDDRHAQDNYVAPVAQPAPVSADEVTDEVIAAMRAADCAQFDCQSSNWHYAVLAFAAFSASRAKPADTSPGSYTDAYYEICSMLGLSAMAVSPKEAHRTVVIPALEKLIAAQSLEANPIALVDLRNGGQRAHWLSNAQLEHGAKLYLGPVRASVVAQPALMNGAGKSERALFDEWFLSYRKSTWRPLPSDIAKGKKEMPEHWNTGCERDCFRGWQARAIPLTPTYWQWRRKGDAWGEAHIYSHELFATSEDSEVRRLAVIPDFCPSIPARNES